MEEWFCNLQSKICNPNSNGEKENGEDHRRDK